MKKDRTWVSDAINPALPIYQPVGLDIFIFLSIYIRSLGIKFVRSQASPTGEAFVTGLYFWISGGVDGFMPVQTVDEPKCPKDGGSGTCRSNSFKRVNATIYTSLACSQGRSQ